MSSGCGDVLSLADLQTAKKHQIFEAEVITGKSGGVAGGADIDYATNAVTGQTQKTLPAVLRDAGFSPVSWDFSTGGTLTANDRDKVVYDPVSKTWYSYTGTLPVVVPASFNPVGNANWKPQSDPYLRDELANTTDPALGAYLIGTIYDGSGAIGRGQNSKNYDWISLKDFGAAGDGVTDDTVALQSALDWLKTGSNKTLLIPGGEYLISAVSVTFSGLSSVNNNIVGDGCLRHSATSGDMITISGAMYCSFNLNIVGDGYDTLTIPNYQTADPTGCQQAIVFAGNRACKLKVRATGYPGRVLRVKAGGAVKQSFIDLDITTGNDTCGQAMYLQGTDAWGCISFAQTNWDYYGSVLDTITDVSVVYWEAGVKNQSAPSIILNNVVNSHITTLAVGGAKVQVNSGSGITIQKMLCGETLDYGLEVIGSGTGQPKHQITIHSFLSGNAVTSAIRLSNVVGATFTDILTDGGNYGISFYNLCRDIRINGHVRNPNVSAYYCAVGSLENVLISGKMYGAGTADFCDFRNATSTTNVALEDTTIVTGGRYLLTANASNGVTVQRGNWSGTTFSLTDAINYTPRTIRDVANINTRRTAVALTFASGSASGSTTTLTHNLYRAPNEVFVTITDPANTVSAGNNVVMVQSITSSTITFKYSGSSSLANALNFTVTAKCEERSN